MPRLVACVLALALLFGGATTQGFWSDALVQFASLPLLGLSFWWLVRSGSISGLRAPLLIVAAVFALPLLQLVPLPPEIWAQLPGRDSIVDIYDTAGVAQPWLPISLVPAATGRAELSLLPAGAVFLGTLMLGYEDRRRLISLVLVVAIVSVVIDFLQVMQGKGSTLYFYSVTNNGNGVGFFANENHNAALLYSVVPLATAWGLGISRRSKYRHIGYFLVGTTIAACVLGLATTTSRAGAALGLLSGLSSIAISAFGQREVKRRRLAIAVSANVMALTLAFVFGFVPWSQRMDQHTAVDDLRWPVASVMVKAIEHFAPAGTGLGSFLPVYRGLEPAEMLSSHYVNHAHDDWLELGLEGSMPAAAIALAFLIWFIGASIRNWRTHVSSNDGLARLGRAGSLVILFLLIHSTVDYPLRTLALMTLFGFAAGLMFIPQNRLSSKPLEPYVRVRKSAPRSATV